MNYTAEYSSAFKKDYKRIVKRGYDIELLKKVISLLLENGTLPSRYRPHTLKGPFKGYMECHILSDWLLVWKIDYDNKSIKFARTGTHSDLF
ncbi:MAG: type II toxin-antitoxin system YafQ family toxin [Bacteroidales bacterium]|nr:type II toxin-antitoxin system YafQ family toxin [Bacteroidales bacterium]